MMALDDLLGRIREIAVKKTEERLGHQKRDVNILILTILTEVYSLEYLLSQLLKTLDELSSREGKNQLQPNQPAQNQNKR